MTFAGLTRSQRNAFVAALAGWSLDAFDFFIFVFALKSIAGEFHSTVKAVSEGIFLTLAMRPVGALFFGWLADRMGRKKLGPRPVPARAVRRPAARARPARHARPLRRPADGRQRPLSRRAGPRGAAPRRVAIWNQTNVRVRPGPHTGDHVSSAINWSQQGDTGMRLRSHIALFALVVGLLGAALGGTASAATVRHVEGRVLSVDRSASTFKLRDSERGTFTIRVSNSTKFERVRFPTLKAGRTVEATIRRVDGRWQATKVEPNSGSHVGETGDDHGRGGGSDDGAGHR